MKKNKNTLNIMEAVKLKAQEAKTEIKEYKTEYISVIDYTEYELEKTEIEKIIKCEEKVAAYSEKLKKNLMGLAEELVQAQKIFANHKNGNFQKWFEKMGLKKTFVYTLLSRQELFAEFNDAKIFQIPERVLPEIKKLKNKVSYENIIKIINSDKPMDVVKNISSDCQTISKSKVQNNEILDAELVEDTKDHADTLDTEIKKLKAEIFEKEQELKILKKNLKEKIDKYENRDNLTIDDLSI